MIINGARCTVRAVTVPTERLDEGLVKLQDKGNFIVQIIPMITSQKENSWGYVFNSEVVITYAEPNDPDMITG